MKIGILSDTHDDYENTNKAIDIFQENDVKAVIHAGDIISPPVITEFYRLTEKGVKLFCNNFLFLVNCCSIFLLINYFMII